MDKIAQLLLACVVALSMTSCIEYETKDPTADFKKFIEESDQ